MIEFDIEEKKEIYTSVNYLLKKIKDNDDGYDTDIITRLDDLLYKITDWIIEED